VLLGVGHVLAALLQQPGSLGAGDGEARAGSEAGAPAGMRPPAGRDAAGLAAVERGRLCMQCMQLSWLRSWLRLPAGAPTRPEKYMNCSPWLGPLAGWVKYAGGSGRLWGLLWARAGGGLVGAAALVRLAAGPLQGMQLASGAGLRGALPAAEVPLVVEQPEPVHQLLLQAGKQQGVGWLRCCALAALLLCMSRSGGAHAWHAARLAHGADPLGHIGQDGRDLQGHPPCRAPLGWWAAQAAQVGGLVEQASGRQRRLPVTKPAKMRGRRAKPRARGDVSPALTSRDSPEGCGASCTCSMASAPPRIPAGLPRGAPSQLHLRVACPEHAPSLARSRAAPRQRVARLVAVHSGRWRARRDERIVHAARRGPGAARRRVNGASELRALTSRRCRSGAWRQSHSLLHHQRAPAAPTITSAAPRPRRAPHLAAHHAVLRGLRRGPAAGVADAELQVQHARCALPPQRPPPQGDTGDCPGAPPATCTPPAGAKIAVLLTDSHASRNAYKMARALTSPERDVMHLITCVPSQEFRCAGPPPAPSMQQLDARGCH
jgi:hypothetical protein